jgi:hypothetical protein
MPKLDHDPPDDAGPSFNKVFAAIKDNSILQCDEDALKKHARALTLYHEGHPSQDQISASLLLHHLLLSKVVERFDANNRRTTRLVILLSVIAILLGAIQAFEAYLTLRPKADERPTSAKTPSAQLQR